MKSYQELDQKLQEIKQKTPFRDDWFITVYSSNLCQVILNLRHYIYTIHTPTKKLEITMGRLSSFGVDLNVWELTDEFLIVLLNMIETYETKYKVECKGVIRI